MAKGGSHRAKRRMNLLVTCLLMVAIYLGIGILQVEDWGDERIRLWITERVDLSPRCSSKYDGDPSTRIKKWNRITISLLPVQPFSLE